MTKSRLSQEQHTELGRALAAIHDELIHRTVQLDNAYPVAGPEAVPARKLDAAIRAVNQARNALENALFNEHPNTATTRTYYPPPQDRAATRDRLSGPSA